MSSFILFVDYPNSSYHLTSYAIRIADKCQKRL
nr:MAG TPA: hypothetical protein [Caudoviricetes sp.]